MGYALVARHKTRDIELWQQGDITYVLNAEPGSHAARFVGRTRPLRRRRWPGAWSMRKHAYDHAVAKGAKAYDGDDKTLDVPAIVGIGGSLLYFVDKYGETGSPYDAEFDWLGEVDKPKGVGLLLSRSPDPQRPQGQHGQLVRFLRQDRSISARSGFFDIEGKLTGLFCRALTSPCGRSAFRSTRIAARQARSRNT